MREQDKYIVKISLSDILAILIYHLAVVNIYVEYVEYYTLIRRGIAVVLAIFFILNGRIFIKKSYLIINVCLMIFSIVVLYSSIHGKIYGKGYFPNTVLYVVTIVEFFLCMEYFNFKSVTDRILDFFLKLSIIYCLVTDILMFTSPFYVTMSWGERYYYYFIGDKFEVAYFHMLLISLFYIRHCTKQRKNKIILALLFLLLIATSIFSECTTGLVGVVILGGGLWGRQWLKKIVDKPWIILVYTLFCASFSFWNTLFLSIPFVRTFIENVLHESITLTGRTNIYLEVGFITQSPWWGFGYDRNNLLTERYIGVADVQNGILDTVVSYGVIGTMVMLVLMLLAVSKGAKRTYDTLFILLYALITLSMIEITFRRLFFAILAMTAFLWEENESEAELSTVKESLYT